MQEFYCRRSVGTGVWAVLVPMALILVLLLASCSESASGSESVAVDSPETATVPVWAAASGTGTVSVSGEPSTADPEPSSAEVEQPLAQDDPKPSRVVPTPSPTEPPEPLAAIVNGQAILLVDYERRVAQYEQSLVQEGLDLGSEEGSADLALMRREVLDGMIELVLMEQGAVDLGVVVSEEDLATQMAADIEAGGGEAAFADWLEATNQTRDDYAEMLYESLLAQRVVDIVGADVPSEAEQVHVRRIVVTSEEEAQEILALLEQGSDFEELAASHSVDLGTKDEGGDLGWFPRGVHAAEVERAAFALEPGEYSGVLQLGEEYHVLELVDHDPERALTSEAIIDLKLAALEQWLQGLQHSADIERYMNE